MILLKKLTCMLPIFLFLSCSKTHPRVPMCTTRTSIQYSTCNASSGCTLSFSCSPTHQSGKLLGANTIMQISSITINKPSLLQATAGKASTNWYNKTTTCIKEESNVTCPNFLPIANDFTIKGILDNQNVTVHVTIDNTNTPVVPFCGSAICGQTGTTVQRMFDCSQRVENFAGIGNGHGDISAFIPGNPNPNWFLVSSPSENDNLQAQCFWLSPVMNSSNPAAGMNQFDSNGVSLSTYANSSITQGRFLWSGMSTSPYDFFQTNGYNPRKTIPASYDYYFFTDLNVMAQQLNAGGTPASDGPLIYSPQNASTTPVLVSPIICAGTSDPCYQSGGDNTIYNLYSPVATAQNQSPCSTNTVAGINLLLGTAYVWQIPSYPMMMTLTGGAGSSCESSSGSTPGTDQALCNGGVDAGEGISFKAMNSIPNFSVDGSTYFWSSSISDPSSGWYYNANGGAVQNGLSLTTTGPSFFTGIRCVSATW